MRVVFWSSFTALRLTNVDIRCFFFLPPLPSLCLSLRLSPLCPGRYQLGLARKVHLIEALKEVKMQEADSSYMSPEYLQVLEDAAEIQKQHKQSPRALEALSGIITDLYVDMHKFRGRDMKHKIPDLMRLLDDYDHDTVVGFFMS